MRCRPLLVRWGSLLLPLFAVVKRAAVPLFALASPAATAAASAAPAVSPVAGLAWRRRGACPFVARVLGSGRTRVRTRVLRWCTGFGLSRGGSKGLGGTRLLRALIMTLGPASS